MKFYELYQIKKKAYIYIDHVAQAFGLFMAYNLGIQKGCWLNHLQTNCIGNDGFLKFELR